MTEKDIRIANLKAILASARFGGNKSKMAREAARHSEAERNPSFFSDLLSGRKSFGGELARSLERELRLERLSLDQTPQKGRGPPPIPVPDWPFEFEPARLYDLDEDQLSLINARILGMIEAFESERSVSRKKTP